MAKTSNKVAPEVDEIAQVNDVEVVEQETVETQQEETKGKKASKEKEVAADILALMKLYPHYEEFYVTPNGFVHPAGVPEYLRKGATLYKNKFYNK